ncbi:hypothetical protein KP509_1Z045400 [Ceratopteris richardii]|nr:hypothetical protein KP509_1Z045400 [Ceratopteris richardii]
MYAKCSRLEEAVKVFDGLLQKDVVSWNAIIGAFCQQGKGVLAVNYFAKMQQEGECPDMVTYLLVAKACGCMNNVDRAKQVHSQAANTGQIDVVIGSSLVDMYGKCGNIKLAEEVFDALSERNVVSWNGLIGSYVQQELSFDTLDIIQKMADDGLKPNHITFLCLLKACSKMASLEQGEKLHALSLKDGLNVTEAIGNALVDMYAKCGNINTAQRVFDELPYQSIISWCALISGYSENGHGQYALDIFERMLQEGIDSDRVMFLCALKACSGIEFSVPGNQIYNMIIESGLECDITIGNALLDMYSKCGRLEDARKVLDQLNMDVISFNTMILAYIENDEAFHIFGVLESMWSRGIKADKVTLILCLKASGSIGAFLQGKLIHELIVRESFDSDIVINTTLVDMYCNLGRLDEARNVFDRLADPNLVSYSALIVGYARQGKVIDALEQMKVSVKRGLVLDDKIYVTLFMAFSHAGYIEEGCQQFESMVNHGITPKSEHFNCLMDLLCRSGHLREAERILQSMPKSLDMTGWMSFLTACNVYGNSQLGSSSFGQDLSMEATNTSVCGLMPEKHTCQGKGFSKSYDCFIKQEENNFVYNDIKMYGLSSQSFSEQIVNLNDYQVC